MGPDNAACIYAKRHPEAKSFEVTLYGSLAATGKGHMTDVAIIDVLSKIAPVNIVWQPKEFLPFHPNGMKFTADGGDEWTVYSVGGGALSEGKTEGDMFASGDDVYEMNKMKDIMAWCNKTGHGYWEYVEQCEGPEIWDYLKEVFDTMQKAVERGIDAEGALPGPLGLARKAVSYYVKSQGYTEAVRYSAALHAYALAVSEENACGGTIVTAPTCGSCGILPAILYEHYHDFKFSEQRVLRALATAGLFGNVVKHNASISGAEVGCQGEVGVACAMAAAAGCQIWGGTSNQIEYAAEMGLEHHLGLTCDPICGLVQIPCIERNAFAAARAADATFFAITSDGNHRISFDHVVEVMKRTGHDLPSLYKETSEGGLALEYKD
jgi:L-serine dehydratase